METPRWLDAREDRAWRNWLAMSERLRGQVAHDLLADSGLSDADYMVLVHLSEADGHRVRVSDLAGRLNWSKSRLSHQLDRMQARGLVERQHCPSDRRGTFAVLAPCGQAEIERAAPDHVASVRRHFIDILDADQLDQLAAIAERVVGHLSSQTACSEVRAGAGGEGEGGEGGGGALVPGNGLAAAGAETDVGGGGPDAILLPKPVQMHGLGSKIDQARPRHGGELRCSHLARSGPAHTGCSCSLG